MLRFLFLFLLFLTNFSIATEYLPKIDKLFGTEIDISHQAPAPEEFVALRTAAGMRERSVASAEKGLKNSVFCVTLRHQGQLIGMGRIVGDGGTVVQVTDIAVHPAYQKRGYGKLIFDQIQEFILREIPDDAFVCLFAEKEIAPFYQNYGYLFSQEWPGMYWPCLERKRMKEERQSHQMH